MRDTKRIRKFCGLLAEIWESQCPDWRFGQLVENVYRGNNLHHPFFIEDDEMMECFKRYFHLDDERGEEIGSSEHKQG